MALAATAARWDASRMPSLEGKIVVVTGANAGIGFEAAVAMAARGAAHVVLACRNEARGRAAEQEIRARTGNDAAAFMALDVGSLASVRAFVAAFHARFDRLDILVNNAGVMHPPTPTTADGFEAHFGVNHLGHFYLTALLFESLRNARDEARVVCVSSTNHRYVSASTDFGALGRENTGRRTVPMDAYSTSKLCNLLFTYELSRRLARAQNTKVKAVACHPGITMTNIITDAVMANRLPAWAQRAFSKAVALLPIFQSPEVGALPTLFAATEPGVASGEYIGPDGWRAFWGYPTRDESSPLSHSLEAAAALWARSEELLQIQFEVRGARLQ